MHIDIPRVKSAGQRIGRLSADADSVARSADGQMRQAAQSGTGFSAIDRLGQVLDDLGRRLGGLISGTDATGRDVSTAAQSHSATDERGRSAMESLDRQLPPSAPGESLSSSEPGTATAPGPTPNPLREVLGVSEQTGGHAQDQPGEHTDDGQPGAPAGNAPIEIPQVDPDDPASREAFVEAVGNAARAGQQETGVPASVSAAQAIWESGWGDSGLTQNDNNFFGIKCQDGDYGPNATGCAEYPTWEVIDGQRTEVNAEFRSYDDPAGSFADHGQFLRDNPRYAEAFEHTEDPDQFIREVHNAGYATDENYADDIISVMRANDLYRFDSPAGQ